MRNLFILWLIASEALGGTYMTYKPNIDLSPGQCVIMGRNRVCAVKAYKIIHKVTHECKEPEVVAVFTCEEGFITTGLTGWMLLKDGERIAVFRSDERERCEQEAQKMRSKP